MFLQPRLVREPGRAPQKPTLALGGIPWSKSISIPFGNNALGIRWYNRSGMKTALSMDDSLLREADRAARSMGLSRSRLFSLAIGEFLGRRRREEMLRRLNEVYADQPQPEEERLLRGIKAKVRRTVKERW